MHSCTESEACKCCIQLYDNPLYLHYREADNVKETELIYEKYWFNIESCSENIQRIYQNKLFMI